VRLFAGRLRGAEELGHVIPVIMPPSVSVVVCTRDRPAHLENCLRAAQKLRYPNFEILVVNNRSSETQILEMAGQFHARYVYVPKPGLSIARNAGARASSAEIIAYLDDDSLPEPHWLDHLVQEFRNPNVLAVAGRIEPVSVETEAELFCEEMSPPAEERRRRLSVDRNTADWFAIANFGGIGIGCNMAFRREAWSIWPGFDERLGRGACIGGSEEHFAFFSLIDKGYCVVYCPDAVVQHPYLHSMEGLRERYLKDKAEATAYASLLFFEFPQYRKALIRILIARWKRSPRAWRERRRLPGRIAPKWRVLIALLWGPVVYLKTRTSKT